ncbi:hypothetical protein Tco_0998325 [Tanacetum coccineum]
MASFGYRLNPLYAIKECSSCGALYTTDYCCSKGSLIDKIIRERPPQNCATCRDPVDGLYCRPCAFVRKCLNEGWYTIHDENEILNTSESSNDNTNVVSAPQEPFIFNQDPEQAAKDRNWKIPICYDDDEDDTIAVTPVLLTEELVDSLIMKDEHLDTILATESDEVINSSVEELVPIPSESEGIPENVCDVPLCNNPTPFEAFKDYSEIVVDSNEDSSSSDDDSFSSKDIEYVDASPPDAETVSSEVVEIVIPEVGGIDIDILLTIKDDILREKLLNVNLLIANIEALKDNPYSSFSFVLWTNSGSTTTRFDLFLPDYEAFYDHIEEKSSGSTTTQSDISLSKYDSFIFDLSINPFPPADRSDFYHEEFADELAHIMPLPELKCFYFKSEPDMGDLTFIDPGIRENVSSMTNVNLPFEDDQSSLFSYVVWIFLPFLTYPVTPPYLLSCGNEDSIFDPDISIYHSFMPGVSHRSGTFMKFNDFSDCDDSRARGFCPSITRASHPQLHLGIEYPNLID